MDKEKPNAHSTMGGECRDGKVKEVFLQDLSQFFLTTVDLVPPDNIWQYLETFLFDTTKGVVLAA